MGILKSFLTMLLSCKFGCHFTCFPKSSICLCPLKLEDTQHSYSSPLRIAQYMEIKSPGDRIESDKNGSVDGNVEVLPKSSLKRPTEPGCKEVGRRRVKWLDLVGKELVEVREFVPIEAGKSKCKVDINPSHICRIQ